MGIVSHAGKNPHAGKACIQCGCCLCCCNCCFLVVKRRCEREPPGWATGWRFRLAVDLFVDEFFNTVFFWEITRNSQTRHAPNICSKSMLVISWAKFGFPDLSIVPGEVFHIQNPNLRSKICNLELQRPCLKIIII